MIRQSRWRSPFSSAGGCGSDGGTDSGGDRFIESLSHGNDEPVQQEAKVRWHDEPEELADLFSIRF